MENEDKTNTCEWIYEWLIDKIYCYTQNIKNKCNKPACAIINHEEKLQKKNDESFTTR